MDRSKHESCMCLCVLFVFSLFYDDQTDYSETPWKVSIMREKSSTHSEKSKKKKKWKKLEMFRFDVFFFFSFFFF